MNSLMKLRLVVTLLLVIMIISIAISIMAVYEGFENDEEFYESLSDEELDQIESIFSKYPENNTESTLQIAGLMIYAVGFGLLILTGKLWMTKNI